MITIPNTTYTMITIPNTTYTSGISLAAILNSMTKVKMLDICRKLDLYVSPNVKKDETARRLAAEILDQPLAILCNLCKNELLLVKEFVDAGPNAYILRKMRKTHYKLQKYGLVVTYQDFEKNEWHMLMPDSVRESLSVSLPALLDMVEKTGRVPSYKELRVLAYMNGLGL